MIEAFLRDALALAPWCFLGAALGEAYRRWANAA